MDDLGLPPFKETSISCYCRDFSTGGYLQISRKHLCFPRLHHSMCLAITTDAKGNRQLGGLHSVKMEGIWEGPVFWYRWARNFSAAADWCVQQVTPVSWWKQIPWTREMTLPKALKLLQITVMELREYPTIFLFLSNILEKFQILILLHEDDTPGKSFVFVW